jgi:hypothetical protein
MDYEEQNLGTAIEEFLFQWNLYRVFCVL